MKIKKQMRPGLILILVISSFSGLTQINPTPKPKLIVGIVVDQMRYEYLVRFYDKFAEGGFKQLMNYGFNGSGQWIETASNDQLVLNYDLISENGLDLFTVQRKVAQLSMGLEQVSFSISALDMQINNYSYGYNKKFQLGYHPKRSGDVLNILHPGYISSSRRAGTTHGSGYNYNSHVPLVFYGWKIPKGRSVGRIEITDIAPTLSMLLNIRLPGGAHGNPIIELFD